MTELSRRLAAASFARLRARRPGWAESGQATTEYVLILIGVAAIALAVVTWATQSGKVGELLDRVFDSITSDLP